ncbi:MAG TPA: hypothetical protein VGK56_03940 [Anaerolineales bacterium]
MSIYLPSQPRKAIWYFVLAYWIVTLLGILLTVAFAAIFQPPSPQELGIPLTQAPAYLMTLPYHPLLNLFWLLFAWMYLRGFNIDTRLLEAFKLGTFWAVICILIDLIGWILIPHPWAMTFKEFYVDYQPWITLIYLVIFASPIFVIYFQRRTEQ